MSDDIKLNIIADECMMSFALAYKPEKFKFIYPMPDISFADLQYFHDLIAEKIHTAYNLNVSIEPFLNNGNLTIEASHNSEDLE